MKRLFSLLLLTLVLVACSTDGGHFKFDGRLLNLNQGEFFIYSTDGLIDGFDTIRVSSGRFSYDIRCDRKGTLVIVFPNFSEQPVFAEPGKIAEIKGSASNLKEMKVTGTDDNKLMNKFREQCKNSSPDEVRHYAELFITDHPESIVSIYIFQKYFLKTPSPDYDQAMKLMNVLLKAQPNNGRLVQLSNRIQPQAATSAGKKLQPFKTKDINGNAYSSDSLMKGDAVIYLWATWEYESGSIQRMFRDTGYDSLHVLGICLDTSLKRCKTVTENNKIKTPMVCDELGFDGELVQQLGFYTIPDNIVLKDGKIVGRNLTQQELRDKFWKKKED